ncbi:dynamin-related GTPase MGM1 [Saccharomyces paradoxus]|uniref:dynamin GTPase n=1 Tax=Saccharomyces paradoxus TaxID=27291 RepID=A0A8B8V038_SACPA|nr:Mgm1 [Saccharomyces paradoxus]QHS76306.1 Mgm1 [Saccharomyces paradoxus]
MSNSTPLMTIPKVANYSALIKINASPVRLFILRRRFATHPAILFGPPYIKSPLVHLHSRISTVHGTTNANTLHFVITRRSISNFPRIISKIIRLPIYVGGGMAAAGSYIAYKMEEANSFTRDKLDRIKDFGESMKEKFNKMFSGDESQNGGSGNDGTVPTATLIAATSLDDDESKKQEDPSDDDDEDDDEDEENDAVDTTQDEMLNLTKQMIEIRTILNKVDSSSAHLTLPSIVVIGSQSSGKSSVLESIVGKEFLPKGSNMVTRRPIELTLVNTPNSNNVTADFPSMRLYNIKDFKEVKRMLMELNMAVPTSEAVSEEPIQLTIKSSRVPDLSLVDLPGYIQVEAADQPIELKTKIRDLCEKYLTAPNIILAISAADVDLANSSALKASKAADPKGLRTIGVITKLDLVDPEKARSILNNKKYPLSMGYVGVITKTPSSVNRKHLGLFGETPSSLGGIFSKGQHGQNAGEENTNGLKQIMSHQFEKAYFKENKKYFANCQVSTKKLREKLIKILEISMSNALEPTSTLIQQELDDTSYLFKVEFNDRHLTPKSYLLNNIDVLKLGIKEFQEKFHRNELKSILRAELDQKVLDVLATRYWKDDNLPDLSSSKLESDTDMLYWHKKLELASSGLTKMGIGRLSTMLTTNAILKELDNILESTQLKNHELIKDLVSNTAINVLNSKYYSTADQVENCIKPFKYEIDLEERDWSLARQHSINLIKEELRQCNSRYQAIKNAVGSKKLANVMGYLENESNLQKETLGMSKLLLERGSEAIFLDKRCKVLSFRLKMLKSKCHSTIEKDRCPEVFLSAVSDKLTSTAVLFLNVELLSDFFYNFPIELDRRLTLLGDEQVEMFAKEDPKISRHIELQKRKELLELALEKIDSILVFKKSYKGVSKNL